MHINVSDILASDLGQTESFAIDNEQPQFSDLELAEPISGHIELMKIEEGIGVRGEIQTAITLECHRCLNSFVHPVATKLTAEFREAGEPEFWPIAEDHTIDLAPPIREELIINIPIKQLCRADCPGISSEFTEV